MRLHQACWGMILLGVLALPNQVHAVGSRCQKYQSTVQSGVGPIIADLRASTWELRATAAQCLADRGVSEEVVEALKSVVADNDQRVRRSALSSLGELRRGGTLFVQALSDSDVLVRFVGAKYAWQAKGSAAAPLAARVADRQEDIIVRLRAAKSIEQLGSSAAKAVPALLPMLNSKDAEVRIAVIKALGAIGSAAQAALPRLQGLLRQAANDDASRGWIREAIARINV